MTDVIQGSRELAALDSVIAEYRSRRLDPTPLAGMRHLEAARIAVSKGARAEADDAFAGAIDAFRSARLWRELAYVGLEAARYQRAEGRPHAALTSAGDALAGAERAWWMLDPSARLAMPELLASVAELAMPVALEAGAPERLFDFMQLGKSGWLLDLALFRELTQRPELRAILAPGARAWQRSSPLKDAFDALDRAWAAYFAAADDEVRDEAEQDVRKAYVEDALPRAALRPASPVAATLEEVRTFLRPDEAILEIFVTTSATFAVFITRETLDAAKIPVHALALKQRVLGGHAVIVETEGRRSFENKLAHAETETRKRQLRHVGRILYPAPIDFLRHAYEAIVKPFEPRLSRASRLNICPHGMLGVVPFHALENTRGEVLADRVVLSYAPSATLWASQRRTARPFVAPSAAKVTVLGVERRPHSPQSELVARALGAPMLEPPPAEAELEAVATAKAYGVEPVLGLAATKSAFFEALATCDDIHVAARSTLGRPDELGEGIQFADGILTLAELASTPRLMGARASVVVLSAADTELPHVDPGERAVCLGQALSVRLGAVVLESMWPTDPEATALLVSRLHAHRRGGAGWAEALQRAQRDVREAWSSPRADGTRNAFEDPYYWAGFFIFGA